MPGWVVLAALVGAGGWYLLRRSREGAPRVGKILGVAVTPDEANRWATSVMLKVGLQNLVPIARAVLVPQGLVASGAVLTETWSSVMTGGQPLADVFAFTRANGITYLWHNERITDALTTGTQQVPGELAASVPKQGYITTVAGGLTQESADVLRMVYGQEEPLPAIHGAAMGLCIFPKLVWRPGELRAWSRQLDIWMFGGPSGNRLLAERLWGMNHPGVAALYNSHLWSLMEMDRLLVGKKLTLNGEKAIYDFGALGQVRGAGWNWAFVRPSETTVWARYIQLCCHLAALGYLSQPQGNMTIPRFRDRSGDSGGLGTVLGGIKEAVFRHADVAVASAVGGPGAFAQSVARAGLREVRSAAVMAEQAAQAEGKVPWGGDWAPMLVNADVVGSKAPNPRRYHTWGDSFGDGDSIGARL